jgi:hypothetical protein
VDPDRVLGFVLRRRWPVVAAALALAVSACGTDSTTDDASAQGDNGASVAASSEDRGDAAETADDGGDAAADTDGEGAPETASEPETEAAAAAVNVPAVEVLDVADGSVINLADELAGEDRAVLFWFWAPH